MSGPKVGFELGKITLRLENLLPVRQIKDPEKRFVRYRTILASIQEVGLIEPLVVYPQKGNAGDYLILDGHMRFFALKELGLDEAACIVSTEDESFTYNAKVSRLCPIQEHAMIMKAIRSGVTPERVAAALNMRLEKVLSTINLLDGIHADAVDLLKDKQICPAAIRILKKVSAIRQIEIAELMVSTGNFTKGYAQALLMGTPKDQLVNPEKPKAIGCLSPEEIARMEHEMESLERDFKAVEESYGENVLHLTLARGYVKKLLENAKVVRFLSSKHPDIFSEFETLAAAESL